MLDVFTLTRNALGPAPRRLPTRFVRPAPSWALAPHEDPVAIGDRMFREGYLTPGYIVQASSVLFEPSLLAAAAVVLHAPGRAALALDTLIAMTAEVSALLSSRAADPESLALARRLSADEPLVRLTVPRVAAQGAHAELSSVAVRALDLPGRHLRAWCLPLLAHETLPGLIVLPAALWARDLLLAWEDLAAEGHQGVN